MNTDEEWQIVEIAFVNSDISSGTSSEAPKSIEEVKEVEVEKEMVKKSAEATQPVSTPT